MDYNKYILIENVMIYIIVSLLFFFTKSPLSFAFLLFVTPQRQRNLELE